MTTAKLREIIAKAVANPDAYPELEVSYLRGHDLEHQGEQALGRMAQLLGGEILARREPHVHHGAVRDVLERHVLVDQGESSSEPLQRLAERGAAVDHEAQRAPR